MTRRRLNRRSFLKGIALAAAAGTVPSFNILGAGSPNEKLSIAHIGLGKRASQQIVKFWNNDLMAPHCRSVAFADPWDDAGLQSWAVSLAKEVRKSYSQVPRFKDFRKMFDQMGKDIDYAVEEGADEAGQLLHCGVGVPGPRRPRPVQARGLRRRGALHEKPRFPGQQHAAS